MVVVKEQEGKRRRRRSRRTEERVREERPKVIFPPLFKLREGGRETKRGRIERADEGNQKREKTRQRAQRKGGSEMLMKRVWRKEKEVIGNIHPV